MLRIPAHILIALLAVAPARAQYTERWSDNFVPANPQTAPAPAPPQAYTERWSERPGTGDTAVVKATARDKLQEVAEGVGEVAGLMEYCGLGTEALGAAFNDLLMRLDISADERRRRGKAHDAARAAAHRQAAASGKVKQGACPPTVIEQVRTAHRDVVGSLGQITPVTLAAAEGRPIAVTFEGRVNNSDVGISSTAALSLTIAGDRLTGFLRTQPPLHGTGPVTGRAEGEQCMLRGRMQEGFDITITGRCGADRFDGRYTVMVNGQPQNGTFAMSRTAVRVGYTEAAPPAPPGGDGGARAAARDLSALPVVEGGKIPGRVEVRSGCDKLFSTRTGPRLPIRWYGVTETVTVIGRRTDGELCAVYDNGSSEWVAADRVMTAAEKQAHDADMQALGAGLERRHGGAEGASGNARDMMDRLRETGNALNRETADQYRQTEKYYEDQRRLGR